MKDKPRHYIRITPADPKHVEMLAESHGPTGECYRLVRQASEGYVITRNGVPIVTTMSEDEVREA